MTCEISYEAGEPLSIPYEEIVRTVVETALDLEGCPYEAEVSVTLTSKEEVRRLNLEFRGIDQTTDVLSFPMAEYVRPADFDFLEEDEAMDCFNPETGELLLGDIVLSVEKIKEQAEAYGHSLKRELAFLTAHSMLHLMGYDHMEQEERRIMEERQQLLMEALDIPRD
ncbi:MAG: rRNA maturation RNase YbeY [Lachnospiraceae bacterium]|nr:rRNA maturation RNase YbeY [Lachnospiraceae bacterium]